ncbi:putative ribonuclease H-like superfamily [Helianthus anomalus]
MSRTYYKLPLVWIKLQKTGLNVEVDRLLEIACVITDGKLRKSVESKWEFRPVCLCCYARVDLGYD